MTVRGQDADWGDDAADADAYIMVIKVKYMLKRLHTKAVTELLMIVAIWSAISTDVVNLPLTEKG